jgi:CRP-like cAMP-binding protein
MTAPSSAAAETCHFRRHQHLVRDGERPRTIYRVEDGWACRYRMLGGGRRQITGLFLPGEYCEPQWLLGERAQFPIVALTVLRASSFRLDEFAAAKRGHTEGVKAMLAATLCAFNRQADWIVTLGRRSALERLCALLYDIFDRLRRAGRTFNDKCAMPLTQGDMADIVGLTPVHVNRVLQQMRAQGLIELRGKWLRVPDAEALQSISRGEAKTSQAKGNRRPDPVPAALDAVNGRRLGEAISDRAAPTERR